MIVLASCAAVACGAYWFHAGDELGYPPLLGGVLGFVVFQAMYWIWPGGLVPALGTQIGLVVLVAVVGTIRLNMRK